MEATLPPAHVLRYCQQITRSRARNFYYGLKLLPEPRRTALYAMYAWMRRADDLVDGSRLDEDATRKRLAAFREATDRALAGDPPDEDPMWAGVSFVADHFNLQREHLHAMIDGQLEDLAGRRFDDFASLRDYCYRVASTVGLVCIEIWGYNDPAARELAIDRGTAFQLTNILRDFREDYDSGRVYLPADELREHDLTAADLRQWRKPEACRRFVLMHVQRAESYYERSAALDGMITPACRPTLWAMTAIYRSLLEKIRADPARVAGAARLRLSAVQKAMIAVQAKWRLPRQTNHIRAGT